MVDSRVVNHGPLFAPNPYTQFYPEDWPANPFHEGEIELQRQVGVHEKVMSYAPKVVRPYMPEQHRDFYEAQPFLVAAARDKDGAMWSTLLVSPSGTADLTRSPDPQTLQIFGGPVQGDALEGVLSAGADLGLLGIEFATKRRNRVNGRIAAVNDGMMIFSTDQSFGNCPQYIKPRQWWSSSPQEQFSIGGAMSQVSPSRSDTLSEEQMKKISAAETIFTATGYRGLGSDVRFGNDASHRGGPAGFVIVRDSNTIILPEFSGNNHFNTMGNLRMDARMGLTIPGFDDGSLLQLSGRGEVDMDQEKAAKTYPGALRLTIFHIDQVNEVPAGSLPIRWSIQAGTEQRQLQVTSIVQEAVNIKSFHMSPLPQHDDQSLWTFVAGQHLPIQLRTEDGELLRTYSLSGPPNSGEYRISVKHEPFGKASSFLHQKIKVGDVLNVTRPAGDFMLLDERVEPGRTIVLLSSGIGVTPILSMLHHIVDSGAYKSRKVYWIQGLRNGKHHPLRGEVRMLQAASNEAIKTHIAYSRPEPGEEEFYDSRGHVTVDLLESVVGDLKNAEYFMCGSGAFMADMEDGLQSAGVKSLQIHFETF